MKKILLIMVLLISGTITSQEFNFSCGCTDLITLDVPRYTIARFSDEVAGPVLGLQRVPEGTTSATIILDGEMFDPTLDWKLAYDLNNDGVYTLDDLAERLPISVVLINEGPQYDPANVNIHDTCGSTFVIDDKASAAIWTCDFDGLVEGSRTIKASEVGTHLYDGHEILGLFLDGQGTFPLGSEIPLNNNWVLAVDRNGDNFFSDEDGERIQIITHLDCEDVSLEELLAGDDLYQFQAYNEFDISDINRPARYAELDMITVSGNADGEYHYRWESYLAFNENDNNGWSVRRNTDNEITGIKLGYTGGSGDQSFVEITGGTHNQIIEAALRAAAHRYGDDDGGYLNDVTYSNNYELYILDVDEFDTGNGERFFATETGRYTKPHSGNNNSSVIDLTPVGDILNAYLIAVAFSTTNTLRYQLELFEPGKYYYHLGPNGVGAIGLASSSTDIRYIDSGNTTEGTHTYWEIQDPSDFGIVKVEIVRGGPSEVGGWTNYVGFYDLRGFAWGDSSTTTHFDGVNGIGREAYFDPVADDAASGIIYSRAYSYALHHNIIDGSTASDLFGTTRGNAALLRSSSAPRGYGLYISGPSDNGTGAYYSLWYSHDLVHDWEQGADNDFQGRGTPSRLSGARIIMN